MRLRLLLYLRVLNKSKNCCNAHAMPRNLNVIRTLGVES